MFLRPAHESHNASHCAFTGAYFRETGFVGFVRNLAAQIQGHRQVTDAYLLGLALRYKARFATLDRGIAELIPAASPRDVLEVVHG
jgi:hypothetical protein